MHLVETKRKAAADAGHGPFQWNKMVKWQKHGHFLSVTLIVQFLFQISIFWISSSESVKQVMLNQEIRNPIELRQIKK